MSEVLKRKLDLWRETDDLDTVDVKFDRLEIAELQLAYNYWAETMERLGREGKVSLKTPHLDKLEAGYRSVKAGLEKKHGPAVHGNIQWYACRDYLDIIAALKKDLQEGATC